MFLDVTMRRNPGLIEAAIAFHQEGIIPANCFLIDLDAVMLNAAAINKAAERLGLSLYFITKQIGFNYRVAKAIVRAGIQKAVAVEAREALVLARNQIAIGHVGHLVQIPRRSIPSILRLNPEVITTFSVAKARQLSEAAQTANTQVSLLLRVVAKDDFFYPGQTGGIYLDDLAQAVSEIRQLPFVRIVGVTSFPCILYDEASCSLRPTPNFSTLQKAARMLQDRLDIPVEQINAPGNTCAGSLEILSQMGATHGEPGHALTGTTPLHAFSDQPEIPALVYVSEVSHLLGNEAFVFGGGLYRRAQIKQALVGSKPANMVEASVQPFEPTAIDYYVSLLLPGESAAQVGDTVVWASRAQLFVSRSYVAVVEGIQAGNPALAGLFDTWGRLVEEF